MENGIIVIGGILYERVYGQGGDVSLRKIGKLEDIFISEPEDEPKLEAIDLGLSVKWASCNVGAEKPYDYGDYFAWGEIEPKSEYTEENSKTYEKKMGSIAGSPTYDAARVNWGGTWRLPTIEEIDELVSKCKREWTNQGGHKGYKITGPNGNSIFLPATGWRGGPSLYRAGESGGYWSATPDEDYTENAFDLYFNGGDFCRSWDSRDYGRSVRPVTE